MQTSINVMPITGLPMIKSGDNISGLICESVEPEDGDIFCIATTIISKAKGYTKKLDKVQPSSYAFSIAEKTGEDPKFLQVVLDESTDILIDHPFVLSEISCGHIGVRAGVDNSNVEDGVVITLPPEPMKEADEIKVEIKRISSKICGIIITDTCGRSFRRGQIGHAIGWSGISAIHDFRGDTDLFGHVLEITEEAVVDEIAGFANFVMGESNKAVPAVLFRNCPAWSGHDSLYFSKKEDVIRKSLALLKDV